MHDNEARFDRSVECRNAGQIVTCDLQRRLRNKLDRIAAHLARCDHVAAGESFEFLLTFTLPLSLWNMQKARYEAEVEKRRRDAGIGTGNA
jgi:hypothetical protein